MQLKKVTGIWSLVSGNWLLVAGVWLQVAGLYFGLRVTGYGLRVTGCMLRAACCALKRRPLLPLRSLQSEIPGPRPESQVSSLKCATPQAFRYSRDLIEGVALSEAASRPEGRIHGPEDRAGRNQKSAIKEPALQNSLHVPRNPHLVTRNS